MVSIPYNEEVLLIGQAIIIAILGVFIGYTLKYLLRKGIDKMILKKIFKDAHTYESSVIINKVLTEAFQWIVIIGALNYSLTLLGFNFLSRALEYFISDIPRIAVFVFIVVAGVLIAKIITSRIREQDIENKNEIITLAELVIMAAFFLTALEYIGVKATALVVLYAAIVFVIAVIIVLIIINPKILKKSESKKQKKSSTTKGILTI